MQLLKTIAAAFSMFSAIPVPSFRWEENNLRYMLLCFPLVGLVIGAADALWVHLCRAAGLPPEIRALGLCLLPVWITGGIHLDGACDTWDALASHASPERKRGILKDPHIGAFAGIRLVMFFLTYWGIWLVLPELRMKAAAASFVLARCLSAAAVASFPVAPGEGLARTFAQAADRRRVLGFSALFALVCAVFLCLNGGACMAFAALAVFLWYRFVLIRSFGGLSGDLAGWFVETAQLWMLIALYAQEILEGFR